MNKKGMDQRCTTTRVLGNRNWEDFMWPHQIDSSNFPIKIPRLDPEVLSFLKKLNLSKLTGIFENEEVLSMEVVLALNEDDLKGIGIKLGDRKIILRETSKLIQAQSSSKAKGNDYDKPPFVKTKQQPKPRKKMTLIGSLSWQSSASSSTPPVPSEHQPQEIESPPPPEQPASASDPPFFLVSSRGSSVDHQCTYFGLYRKTEEMIEGHSVYKQEHDTKYGGRPCKLFSDKGVWRMEDWFGNVPLKAATPSDSPASIKWEYCVWRNKTWHDDPALTVTSLSEKPSVCEVTISLSEDVKREIMEQGVEGVYRADCSYFHGRPVMQHEGGSFTISAGSGAHCWKVRYGVGGVEYLRSGSAPSQCPADPRASRNESRGRTLWEYRDKQDRWPESSGISIMCAKHILIL